MQTSEAGGGLQRLRGSEFFLHWNQDLVSKIATGKEMKNGESSELLIALTWTWQVSFPLTAYFVVVVEWPSHVQLFVTPWTAACQASLSFTVSQSLLKLMSIESVILSTISLSVIPFSSCFQSFPESGSFLVSQLFSTGGQSIEASALHQSFQWIFRVDFL